MYACMYVNRSIRNLKIPTGYEQVFAFYFNLLSYFAVTLGVLQRKVLLIHYVIVYYGFKKRCSTATYLINEYLFISSLSPKVKQTK